MTRIGVVGGGAMGSVYAARLAQAGHEVLVIDRGRDHVAAMNAGGLELKGPDGTLSASVRAGIHAPEEPCDLVILAVKAMHVTEALHHVEPLLSAKAMVVTIQNGLGSAERVIDFLGAERVMIGIASGFGAARLGPGKAQQHAVGTMHLGVYDGGPAERVTSVAEIWRSGGFWVEVVEDIFALQWRKLICNAAYSAPCALSGLAVGVVMDHPELGEVSRSAAVEGHRVAVALGVDVDVDDPVELVREFAAAMPNAKPSALLDHEAERPSEIQFINGAIPRQAERIGMAAPVNAVLTALSLARERQWTAAHLSDRQKPILIARRAEEDGDVGQRPSR